MSDKPEPPSKQGVFDVYSAEEGDGEKVCVELVDEVMVKPAMAS
ncbi:MAG: hypothetical protein WCQ21_24460 [Verrucomicrobiota bacterium]